MTNEQIIQLEHKRVNNLNMIYLIREGNWYKAYEWSAYLLEFYPNNKAGKQLKPIKRNYNNVGELINVSFPHNSLDKYADGLQYNKDSQDDMIPIMTNMALYGNVEINLNNYMSLLDTWKKSIELSETQSKIKNTSSTQNTRRVYTSSEIEQKILGFQYYNSEKEELINFINEIKNMCASRI